MRRKNLFQEYLKNDSRDLFIDMFERTNGYDLPNPAEVLFIGLFRTNLYISESDTESTKLVGWFRNPIDLWAKRSKAVLNDLQSDYADNDEDAKKKNFIRANAACTHEFYIHGMTDLVDEVPEYVYTVDEDDKARYVKADRKKMQLMN